MNNVGMEVGEIVSLVAKAQEKQLRRAIIKAEEQGFRYVIRREVFDPRNLGNSYLYYYTNDFPHGSDITVFDLSKISEEDKKRIKELEEKENETQKI